MTLGVTSRLRKGSQRLKIARFGSFERGMISLHKTRIRMRQVHHQKVDLVLSPANDGKRLAKVTIGLGLTWEGGDTFYDDC